MKKLLLPLIAAFILAPAVVQAEYQEPVQYKMARNLEDNSEMVYKDEQYLYYFKEADFRNWELVMLNLETETHSTIDIGENMNKAVVCGDGIYYIKNEYEIMTSKIGSTEAEKVGYGGEMHLENDFLYYGTRQEDYSLQLNRLNIATGKTDEILLPSFAYMKGVAEGHVYYWLRDERSEDKVLWKVNFDTEEKTSITTIDYDIESFYYEKDSKTIFFADRAGIQKFDIKDETVYAVRGKDENYTTYRILSVKDGWVYAISTNYLTVRDFIVTSPKSGTTYGIDSLVKAAADGTQFVELQYDIHFAGMDEDFYYFHWQKIGLDVELYCIGAEDTMIRCKY